MLLNVPNVREKRFGLAAGIVGTEVFVLGHLLLHAEELRLQFAAQSGQRFADVIGELLIERLLQVGSAHAVGHVSIGRMGEEELTLGHEGGLDVLAAVDVLLRTIDDADVAATQRQQAVLEDFARVRAVVHEIELGDDADGAHARRIDLARQLERVRVGQVGVCRRHGQYETIVARHKLQYHALDLLLDVDRLVADRHLGDARQVDQRQVEHLLIVYIYFYCLMLYLYVVYTIST